MPSSRHAAARQQFMLPCTCNHASDMYPVCQQRRVTAQETCSPNACPDVSKAVQPIPRVPASLLQTYRCGTQAASRKVCLSVSVCVCLCLSVSVCPCVRRAACLMGGPCYALQQGSELGEEAGGCIQQGSFRCYMYIHPSRLPAECILRASLALSRGMCIKVFSLSSSSAGSRHLGFPQDEPSFRTCRPRNAPRSCSGREHALLPSNSFVAGLARTNLVFDCSRAASSGFTVHG
jgi:hypothetical protein